MPECPRLGLGEKLPLPGLGAWPELCWVLTGFGPYYSMLTPTHELMVFLVENKSIFKVLRTHSKLITTFLYLRWKTLNFLDRKTKPTGRKGIRRGSSIPKHRLLYVGCVRSVKPFLRKEEEWQGKVSWCSTKNV